MSVPTNWPTIIEADLWRAQVAPEFIPDGMTIAVIDYASSSSPKADETAICFARVPPQADGKKIFYVLDVRGFRCNIRELPLRIVLACAKYNLAAIKIERLSNYELLDDLIQLRAEEQSINLGHVSYFPPDRKPLAKSRRFAKIPGAIANGTLKFRRGGYLAPVVQQFADFNFGEARNRGRHDDRADSVSLLLKHF